MLNLTSGQRRFLRAQAHSLSPVILIGDAGLTAGVMKEIEHSLNSHELLKIKVAGNDRGLRENMLTEICTVLETAPVQHIGKTLVIYKPANKPRLILPKS
ncbi:MAG: YhbY family RNA-binding protein [Pseudomonadota bacterium]